MISNYSIKAAVRKAYASSSLADDERLACEILLYEYLLDLIENDSTQTNDISTLTSSYSTKISDAFSGLKGKNTAYYGMLEQINGLSTTELMALNETVIERIYGAYLAGTDITDFSISGFSASEYGVTSGSSRDMAYLRKIHDSTIVPIMRHYIAKHGASAKDMKIISATVSDAAPGKMILFAIDGISPVMIVSDILAHRINIGYDDIALKYPYVLLTTN